MAQKSLLLIALLIIFSTLISSTNGRRLLTNARRRNGFPTSVGGSLYMEALPKGSAPASGPSKKGHGNTIDEKLVARHLSSAVHHRFPPSVPSPGVGH